MEGKNRFPPLATKFPGDEGASIGKRGKSAFRHNLNRGAVFLFGENGVFGGFVRSRLGQRFGDGLFFGLFRHHRVIDFHLESTQDISGHFHGHRPPFFLTEDLAPIMPRSLFQRRITFAEITVLDASSERRSGPVKSKTRVRFYLLRRCAI
jgi:hypothetical protein